MLEYSWREQIIPEGLFRKLPRMVQTAWPQAGQIAQHIAPKSNGDVCLFLYILNLFFRFLKNKA